MGPKPGQRERRAAHPSPTQPPLSPTGVGCYADSMEAAGPTCDAASQRDPQKACWEPRNTSPGEGRAGGRRRLREGFRNTYKRDGEVRNLRKEQFRGRRRKA